MPKFFLICGRNISVLAIPFINKNPTRKPEISYSELLTIVLLYHQSPCKNFKYFYMSYLQLYKSDFVTLPSYTRFIALKPRVLNYLVLLLESEVLTKSFP